MNSPKLNSTIVEKSRSVVTGLHSPQSLVFRSVGETRNRLEQVMTAPGPSAKFSHIFVLGIRHPFHMTLNVHD